MSDQNEPFDPIRLAIVQARIRQLFAAGATDEQIQESVVLEWTTMRQWLQVSDYIRFLRMGLGTPGTPGAPKGTGVTVDDVRRVGEQLRGPDGTRPPLQVVAEELGVGARWVSEVCRPAGGYRKVVP